MTKELTISVEDEIEQKILGLKGDYYKEDYYHYGECVEFSYECLTQEEYNENVDRFLRDFKDATEDISAYIERFPKKKNGTFDKRKTLKIAACDNCEYICEWHNTWIYYVVRVVAKSDTDLMIVLCREVDTPA